MPSMVTLTLLPDFIEPTPTEVPMAITSPGSSTSREECHASGHSANHLLCSAVVTHTPRAYQ